MTQASCTAACPRTRQMSRSAYRWWVAEVVREWVANDNEDAAAWCARWSAVAEDMEAKNWSTQADQVRQMVAAARRANRPAVV